MERGHRTKKSFLPEGTTSTRGSMREEEKNCIGEKLLVSISSASSAQAALAAARKCRGLSGHTAAAAGCSPRPPQVHAGRARCRATSARQSCAMLAGAVSARQSRAMLACRVCSCAGAGFSVAACARRLRCAACALSRALVGRNELWLIGTNGGTGKQAENERRERKSLIFIMRGLYHSSRSLELISQSFSSVFLSQQINID
jgi:hypothetical protein